MVDGGCVLTVPCGRLAFTFGFSVLADLIADFPLQADSHSDFHDRPAFAFASALSMLSDHRGDSF